MPNYGVLHQRPMQLGLPAALPDPGYTLDIAARQKAAGRGRLSRRLQDHAAGAGRSAVHQHRHSGAVHAGAGRASTPESSPAPATRSTARCASANSRSLVGRGGGGVEPHPHSNLRALVYNPDNSDAAKLTNFQGWRTVVLQPELNRLIEQARASSATSRQAERDVPASPGAVRQRGAARSSRSRRWSIPWCCASDVHNYRRPSVGHHAPARRLQRRSETQPHRRYRRPRHAACYCLRRRAGALRNRLLSRCWSPCLACWC